MIGTLNELGILLMPSLRRETEGAVQLLIAFSIDARSEHLFAIGGAAARVEV